MVKRPSVRSGGEDPQTELQEFKEFLGPLATHYSDAQLRQLRREMYAMAELLLDIYLYKKRHSTTAKKIDKDFDTPSPTP